MIKDKQTCCCRRISITLIHWFRTWCGTLSTFFTSLYWLVGLSTSWEIKLLRLRWNIFIMKTRIVDTSLFNVSIKYDNFFIFDRLQNTCIFLTTSIVWHLCYTCIVYVLCMLACWVEDPNGSYFKKRLARIQEYLW